MTVSWGSNAFCSIRLMTGWKEILIDVLKLTDEVKRLDLTAEKLAERTINMDKRLVRLETMIEVARSNRLTKKP